METFDIENLPPITVTDRVSPTSSGGDESGRLVISHITNINFKSYAGTTVLGPFEKVSSKAQHDGFDSIAGYLNLTLNSFRALPALLDLMGVGNPM